jgi:hypothetical protein
MKGSGSTDSKTPTGDEYDENQVQDEYEIFEVVPDEHWVYDEEDLIQTVNFLHFMRPSSGVGRKPQPAGGIVLTKDGNTYPDAPNLKMYACFRETFSPKAGGCPNGKSCKYSHSLEIIKDALHESFTKTCHSHAWDSSIPKRVVKPIIRPSTSSLTTHDVRNQNRNNGQNQSGHRNHRLDGDIDQGNQQKSDSSSLKVANKTAADTDDDEDD